MGIPLWGSAEPPMPLYEYRCRECETALEEVQPMGSPPPGPCPACGGELRRIYGRVSVRFSGWGFRRNDSMVPGDRPKKDFKELERKAQEIADS
jgi:putative FmdB family regulatory protein